jgi:hypothetical protein
MDISMNESYIREIRLSRELIGQLENHINNLPDSIKETYKELLKHYSEQVEQGIM